MKIITVTSENYVELTCQMLASLRVWHPDLPVMVYTLDTGWTNAHSEMLIPYRVERSTLAEGDPRNRGAISASGPTNFCVWKLDAFRQQVGPFLFLDSDMLILRPLDEIVAQTNVRGWFAVHEGTRMGAYAEGEMQRLIRLPDDVKAQTSFNTGVLGCDPNQQREVLELAYDWGKQVNGVWLGDQGLLNLAWYHLRQEVPDTASTIYNGGWRTNDRIVLTQTVLHFARPNYPRAGRSKLEDQTRIWQAWPRGTKLVRLDETEFWRESLPHAWPWLNQANQPRYRKQVAELREKSLSLLGTPWLVIDHADEAFLLHDRVLGEVEAFWAEHGRLFKDVPFIPTYHLTDGGQLTSGWSRRVDRWRRTLRSRLPR